MDVEAGSNGDVDDGVSKALRFVEILSSMLARDSRRKSRSTRVSKQNCGFNCLGMEVGWDIISGRGLAEGGTEDEGFVARVGRGGRSVCGEVEVGVGEAAVESGDTQNHASLTVD